MFTLNKSLFEIIPRDLIFLTKYAFSRDVGDQKFFKIRLRHDDWGIPTFAGEDTSISLWRF
jgi:hypothetical protein